MSKFVVIEDGASAGLAHSWRDSGWHAPNAKQDTGDKPRPHFVDYGLEMLCWKLQLAFQR